MGWLSRLFGGSKEQKAVEVEPEEYKGYLIYAETYCGKWSVSHCWSNHPR
ncbi:hypothetical protein JCM19231_1650 [Vibrio ishigakensis]|uniref:Uncharacterized protein n=1 Tax=Vibrio ishigakensis TaxID=1481914 RepID=A0A0B8P2K5_9VIBR|nr:hypothetical protein JCM19231_1650 [Vibrio ishigakensis]